MNITGFLKNQIKSKNFLKNRKKLQQNNFYYDLNT